MIDKTFAIGNYFVTFAAKKELWYNANSAGIHYKLFDISYVEVTHKYNSANGLSLTLFNIRLLIGKFRGIND